MTSTRLLLFSIAAAVALTLHGDSARANQDQSRWAPPFTPAWAAPQLRVDPIDGAPGTEVRITGTDFPDDARVFYGDDPMPIVGRSDDALFALIPTYARGERYVYVVARSGRARSVRPFAVWQPRGRYYEPGYGARPYDPGVTPAVLSLSPDIGEPGTLVRVTGARFHGPVDAYYGDTPARIVRRGFDYLLVEIPLHARHPDVLTVVDRRGELESRRPFELVWPWR